MILTAVALWALAAGFLCVAASALGRAGHGGADERSLDSDYTEAIESDRRGRAPQVGAALPDRRGSHDRRGEGRPWFGSAPGRRAEDWLGLEEAELEAEYVRRTVDERAMQAGAGR